MKESVSAWPNSNPAFRPETSNDVERKIRVAFVEDDDDYREAVSSELGDHGFDVTTFSVVATIFSRSALVNNRGGTYVPTELIFARTCVRGFNVKLKLSPHLISQL